MSQRHYSRGIKELEKWHFRGERRLSEREQSMYRSLLGQLNWLVQHTSPDLAVGVSMVSRKLEAANAGGMRRLFKLAEKAKNCMVGVNMGRLERENVQMEVYSDASFGNVEIGKSQIGYIIGLRDERGERCPLAWKSRVGKRLARSTILAEAIGLEKALEMAVFLREIWRELSGEEVAVVGKIDSKTLERAIVSTTGVSSRRLRIDLAAIKEALEVGRV